MRIKLPDGNECTIPKVCPSNWNKKDPQTKKYASTDQDWLIQYRFYCKEFPEGKLIRHKNFNQYKDVQERRHFAALALSTITNDLHNGYNPLEKKLVSRPDQEADEKTPFSVALQKAYEKIIGVKHTKDVIKRALPFYISVAKELKFDMIPVQQISRKHIKLLLERAAVIRKMKPGNYNHYRAYLSMLFNELVELEAVEHNPVKDIKKRHEVKKIRKTLTSEERKEVNAHLFKHHYTFWRYFQIFFHSGSRSAELFRVRCKDVNLQDQYFIVTVIKGTNRREEKRLIKDIALPLWKEILNGSNPNDFIFSKNLEPGPVAIDAVQITRRWRKHVKAPRLKEPIKKRAVGKGGLGIDKDFYGLKHLHADDVARLISLREAGKHMGHTNASTTLVYAFNEEKRKQETIKELWNEL